MAWHWKPAIRHVCVRRLGKDVPRTVGMMISELDYEIMNNEVVFFFFFLFCRLFLDSGRLHKNDTCCLLLFIYFFRCSVRTSPQTSFRGEMNAWQMNPKDVCGEARDTRETRVSLARAPCFPAPITSWPVNRRCFIFLFVLFKNIGKLASEASAEREKEK